MSDNIRISQSLSLGGLWFTFWLFSIGFLKMGFFQGIFALLLWPYYLGLHFAG